MKHRQSLQCAIEQVAFIANGCICSRLLLIHFHCKRKKVAKPSSSHFCCPDCTVRSTVVCIWNDLWIISVWCLTCDLLTRVRLAFAPTCHLENAGKARANDRTKGTDTHMHTKKAHIHTYIPLAARKMQPCYDMIAAVNYIRSTHSTELFIEIIYESLLAHNHWRTKFVAILSLPIPSKMIHRQLNGATLSSSTSMQFYPRGLKMMNSCANTCRNMGWF